jgi:hypothetical protein
MLGARPRRGLAWLLNPSVGLTWMIDSSSLGVTTLCKCTMDQDMVHYRLPQWIFQALKAWEGAIIVFSHKVKLLFYILVEKLKD